MRGLDWVSRAVAKAAVLVVALCLLGGAPARAGDEDFTPSKHLDLPFPDFSLVDVTGRTWTKADLAGKVVLVNVWATWCVPCNEELPEVQKLARQLDGRKDVVLLTMNVDEKVEKVAPFLAKHGYSFPVLPAYTMLRKGMGLVGIPRTWVLDRGGVIRVDVFGIKTENGSWVEWAKKRLAAVTTLK